MTTAQLYTQFQTLPDAMKTEVADFIAFLQQKAKVEKKSKDRPFGIAKGLIEIADDFDEPLEDFKDYM